ncbi:hypothetical protein THRCLA_20862 [Thraustotheca clavata]|uniref:EF-hand domain-containing protein n=1 Tax=Thraustotheca clavata TaxID=74557 RepID=A0A1W0A2L2_9STRA|nr:hypothetical protein THRCLA_20862 [Thraustotheca clavata]
MTKYRHRRQSRDMRDLAKTTQYTLHKARLHIENQASPTYTFAFPHNEQPIILKKTTSNLSSMVHPKLPTTTQTVSNKKRYAIAYRNVSVQPSRQQQCHVVKANIQLRQERQPQLSCPLPINPIEPRQRLLVTQGVSEFDLRVCHSPRAVTRHHGHLSDYNLSDLMERTGYSRLELYTLWSRFKALVSLSKSPKGVDQATFRRAVPLLSVEDEMFVDRVFAILDEDYSGALEWDEFIRAMAALEKGDLRQRIVFLFQVYDLNGDEKLSREELMTFFISGLMVSSDDSNVQDMAQHFADDILTALGVSPSETSTISISEVTMFIEKAKMEDIYTIFGRTMLNELDKQVQKEDPDLAMLNLENTPIIYRNTHAIMDNI